MTANAAPTLDAGNARILLVGNPNVGKSVLFGALTRRYVVVSNYPGTTVEIARGRADLGGRHAEVVDLPGVNNLVPQSEDERVTRDVLLSEPATAVLQVVDAKNLRRGLLLGVALAETGLPLVVALNMMDEALSRGVRVDVDGLAAALGVPVVPTVATRGGGVARVRALLSAEPARCAVRVDYGADVEAAAARLAPLLAAGRWAPRALALALLAGDDGILEWAVRALPAETLAALREERRALQARLRRPVAYAISQARLRKASELMAAVYHVDPALTGALERFARFGETVAGRGTGHLTATLGAALVLLSLGGFPFSTPAAAACLGTIAAAAGLWARRRGAGVVLLAVVAGLWLLGMAVRPLAEALPEGSLLATGWFAGFAAALIVAGVFLARQTTHLVWGTLGAIAVLYLLYLFVGVFGAGDLVDLLEGGLFAKTIGPACIRAVDALFPFAHTHAVDPGTGAIVGEYALAAGADPAGGAAVLRLLHDMLVGPFGALTMALSYALALILPVVGTFFLAFGLLEDSGYLPRLAAMLNRGFRAMGLNGKAVLPMILGLGCDTMATLTTRVLETKKERVIVTLLLALGVPCSAQLGVILGITSQIGATAILWWVGTIVVVLFTVGFLAARVLPGERSDFILELPPLRLPRAGNIALKTLARVEWYLKEAVPLFFLGTFVLFLLDATGALAPLTWAAAPVVKGLLALPVEVTPSFLIGFLRRDYGAAGLSEAWRDGLLTPRQAVTAMVTITLFVPCVANFLIMIKERGLRTGLLMALFILPFAFLAGAIVNLLMSVFGVLP